jgi:hypothetical protein
MHPDCGSAGSAIEVYPTPQICDGSEAATGADRPELVITGN